MPLPRWASPMPIPALEALAGRFADVAFIQFAVDAAVRRIRGTLNVTAINVNPHPARTDAAVTDEEFAKFCEFLYRKTGIMFDAKKNISPSGELSIA